MNPDLNHTSTAAPRAGHVMCADSVGRTLLAMAVPPEQRRGGILRRIPTLGRRGDLPDGLRGEVLAGDAAAQALPLAHVQHVEAEEVAAWITGHYPAPAYPAVVLGSPHGAAVHLAAACGAAWLPTSFTVTAPWPGGAAGDWAAAMAWGAGLAERILERNPEVTVRQVHDPVLRGPLCGATVTLQIRWRRLPEAYRMFLGSRVEPGGASVLVRDLRTWPVLDGPPRYSFQVGSPTSGWKPADHTLGSDAFRRVLAGLGATGWTDPAHPAPRQYAETSGDPAIEPEVRQIAARNGSTGYRVLYTDPHALSAGVADLYQVWRPAPGGPRHAVVGTGRMTDPWQVVDGGMVPFWCESSSGTASDAAQLWLAGSEPFHTVSVLPDPPGVAYGGAATMRQWRAVAAFAGGTGRIDRFVAHRYPRLPPAAGHATRCLRESVPDPRRPEPMSAGTAVRRLAEHGARLGLLVL